MQSIEIPKCPSFCSKSHLGSRLPYLPGSETARGKICSLTSVTVPKVLASGLSVMVVVYLTSLGLFLHLLREKITIYPIPAVRPLRHLTLCAPLPDSTSATTGPCSEWCGPCCCLRAAYPILVTVSSGVESGTVLAMDLVMQGLVLAPAVQITPFPTGRLWGENVTAWTLIKATWLSDCFLQTSQVSPQAWIIRWIIWTLVSLLTRWG